MAFVRERDLFGVGARVLLMLSGGADSMALLDVMPVVSERLGLRLEFAALHVDYATRGDDSVRDRLIVAAGCAAAGVPLHEVRLAHKPRGGDFQARARTLRYDRARELAAAQGYDAVVTAHHRDDQAETVLYRLAKYASPRGLAGMAAREGLLARPLLCLGAAEIRTYCRARDIDYGEDVTNAQPVYARNLIRLELLPLLERINPRVVETLAAGADAAAAEAEVLRDVTAAALARVLAAPPDGESAALDLERFAREPQAVRALVLHGLVREALGGDALVERRAVAAVLRLADADSGPGRVTLRGGLEAVRGGGLLRLRRRAPVHACEPLALDLTALAAAGREGLAVTWCERRFRMRLEPGPGALRAGAADSRRLADPAAFPDHAFVAAPTEDGRVALRHPRRGERFAPLGLGAPTTVARFLAAARVTPEARARAIVVAVADDVAWVGYESSAGRACGRVAECARVQEGTSSIVHVFEEAT